MFVFLSFFENRSGIALHNLIDFRLRVHGFWKLLKAQFISEGLIEDDAALRLDMTLHEVKSLLGIIGPDICAVDRERAHAVSG